MKLVKKGAVSVAKRILNKIHLSSHAPIWLSLVAENLVATFRKQKVRFSVDKHQVLFRASDGDQVRFFRNRKRGFELYRNGIEKRGEFIFSSYCLQNIHFTENDIVIDCGANSGDLYLKLSRFLPPRNYIGVEPNPSDFDILMKNTTGDTRCINKALGNVASRMSFYVATANGDSSLVEPLAYDNVIEVDVIRLDDLIKDLGLLSIKLLKVEAEGYEPEILEGLGDKIGICEYIAVDGGYERGKEATQTLTTVTNFLLSHDFEMVDINFPGYRVLFKRSTKRSM